MVISLDMLTLVLIGVVLLQAAVIGILIGTLRRLRKGAGAIKPVDILPHRWTVSRGSEAAEEAADTGWRVIDDYIQYEDDRRAEFYRDAWGWEASL